MSYILLLDDDLNYAGQLRSMLETEGLPGEVTDSPSDALERLKKDKVGLVVADFEMPGMNGAEFVEHARVLRPDLPVIIVSGKMGTPETVRVANIGVTFVMEKPVVRDVFLAQVKRFLREGAQACKRRAAETGAAYAETTVGAVEFPAVAAVTRSALAALRTALAEEGRAALTVDDAVSVPRLAQLAAAWFGGDKDTPVLRISPHAGQLAREDAARVGGGAVLAVVAVEAPMALEDVLGALGAVAAAPVRLLIVAESTVAQTAGWFDKTAVLPISVVSFPSVAERIEDIAAAFLAIWRAAAREDPFPSDLARAILGYDWETSPRQLGRSLRLFEALLRRATAGREAADSADEAARFRDVLPADRDPADLAGVLKRAQTAFLRSLLNDAASLEDVAERAGIPVAILETVEDVSELKLLFFDRN